MTHTVLLPDIGETIDEGVVEEWLVEIGDEVEKGEPILTVEVDKATLEVAATAEGVLVRQLVHVEQAVRTGDPLAEIDEA
ncbi:MAG: acetyl-CoA carboxylase biotin carboxyl carrier protein subunit [Immundisolibacterales bacterium]|nr:acetyl-CoA carboxylase biotin carboxyl carrier protein subunit [Immundisolibacterales bacterium]